MVITGATEYMGQQLPVPVNSFVELSNNTNVWYSQQPLFSFIRFIIQLNQPQNNHGGNDVWYINGFYSLRFVLIPLLFGRGKKILCPRGMLDAGSLSQKAFKKKIYIAVFKLFWLHHSCTFHACSSIEAEGIREVLGEKVSIKVVPNIPRLLKQLTLPVKNNFPTGEEIDFNSCLQLTTIAIISPMKNILEVINALALVKEPVHYHIYGTVKDPAYWDACIKAISALPANIRVSYHGSIPQDDPDRLDVPGALAKAHVFIQPSKSENFGHSLVEALSAGRPIITGNNTPWNGLEQAKAGFNVDGIDINRIAEQISFFAQMASDTLQEWSNGACAYCASAINVHQLKDEYQDLFGGGNG